MTLARSAPKVIYWFYSSQRLLMGNESSTPSSAVSSESREARVSETYTANYEPAAYRPAYAARAVYNHYDSSPTYYEAPVAYVSTLHAPAPVSMMAATRVPSPHLPPVSPPTQYVSLSPPLTSAAAVVGSRRVLSHTIMAARDVTPVERRTDCGYDPMDPFVSRVRTGPAKGNIQMAWLR